MKRLNLVLSLLLLLCLTACGTIVRLEGIEIEFPQRGEDPTPTREVLLTPSPSPSPSATVRPTNTPSPTPSPTIAAGMQAFTTANVNLRSVPSSASSTTIIRVLATGAEVRLIGRLDNSNPTWVKTADGWLYSQNLRIVGTLSSLPITPYIPPATSTPVRGKASRIGYNINGEAVPSETTLMQAMTSPCKTMSLVMNNLNLALRIKQACPDTIVISRNYSPLEGDEWLQPASTFVNRWRLEGNPQIIRHSTNEPSFGRGRRLEEFVAKECELMQLARAAGFTLAMGNFSVGIFEPEDVNAGLFDNYLRCLETYGHYLALHEYSVAALPFGVGYWSTAYLLDRMFVQPASWPSASSLSTCPDGQFGSYWYLLRGTWFLCRADRIGVERPQILLTEFGWDNLPNIKPQIEPLRQQYGLPQYFFDMRGVNTYPKLWAYYWPQWSFAQAACEQLKWADRIYPPEYIGFALFTWGWYPGSAWLQTDFSGRENPAHYELHACLAAA